MEVDTNELLHRIGSVLRGISDKLDRLVELASDHFADANKMVADEPAKEPEPEHPPDPGEGYRLLSKNPPEGLMPGDEYFGMWDGLWRESRDASEGIREQRERRWYRRKIEPPKPPQPEYREPVLPGDVMQECEFSMTGKDWYPSVLSGFQIHNTHPWISSNLGCWNFARIKKDA